MSTLKATYLQQASSASPNITLDASTNATVAGTLAMGHSFKRNKIINGNMVIDQRNAGASVTPSSGATYTVDRWKTNFGAASKFSIQQNAGSVTPPASFSNYLGCTSLSAYTVGASESFYLTQAIEGFNTADLSFGTANAKTITVSFWVRCSLTGTFGGSIWNSAVDRLYPFTYTISASNTWEYKTVTIAGDTTGTWIGATNGVGLYLNILLAAGSSVVGTPNTWGTGTAYFPTGTTSVVGTNGATFYITGVQLETGSIATPYERQIYSDQLAQCQRYCYRPNATGGVPFNAGYIRTTTIYQGIIVFPVYMRAAPSLTATSGTNYWNVSYGSSDVSSNTITLSGSAPGYSTSSTAELAATLNSTATIGQGAALANSSGSANLFFSAEL